MDNSIYISICYCFSQLSIFKLFSIVYRVEVSLGSPTSWTRTFKGLLTQSLLSKRKLMTFSPWRRRLTQKCGRQKVAPTMLPPSEKSFLRYRKLLTIYLCIHSLICLSGLPELMMRLVIYLYYFERQYCIMRLKTDVLYCAFEKRYFKNVTLMEWLKKKLLEFL